MTTVPVIPARRLIRVLAKLGFEEIRCRGSHHRFAHPDGRKTTVPVHQGREIPRGLLRKIVTVDLGMDMKEFVSML
ncbi:MAG: type II toxin-antitoxin system HicA family toxin [Planctomycetota bacterium]|nr:type II toxin-antitoxin system HicA family toxin [Planctomycetota bacterium]